jgi:hypothetical protein
MDDCRFIKSPLNPNWYWHIELQLSPGEPIFATLYGADGIPLGHSGSTYNKLPPAAFRRQWIFHYSGAPFSDIYEAMHCLVW